MRIQEPHEPAYPCNLVTYPRAHRIAQGAVDVPTGHQYPALGPIPCPIPMPCIFRVI